jgi:hypothetical protein
MNILFILIPSQHVIFSNIIIWLLIKWLITTTMILCDDEALHIIWKNYLALHIFRTAHALQILIIIIRSVILIHY